MRLLHMTLAAAAAAAAVAAQQSTFLSPSRDLAFALSVPDTDNTDIFFSIRAPINYAWAAVGLGSDDMKGALFLVIYRNKHRDNVTLSPRLAYGNYEPQHYPEMQYDVLPGTGIVDDHMVFNARCTQHCRSWPAVDSNSGYLDVSSPTEKAIYALGPRSGFGSDNPAADLQFHREFGVFTIDIKRTLGAPDPPTLADNSVAVGTSLEYHNTHRRDHRSGLHGTFMVFAVVILLPVGAALRHLGRWARYHVLCQSTAVAIMLGGVATGVLTSLRYQRSRNFRSPHQILGFIVIGFVLVQLALGFLHRRKNIKTHAPTEYGKYHRYLGGIIIVFGTLNAFFGFDLALDYKVGYALCAIVIVTIFVGLFFYLGRQGLREKHQRLAAAGGPHGAAPTGYQPQPWREDNPDGSPREAPPSYDASSSQHIGLQPVSAQPSPWRSSDVKDGGDDQPALGGAQHPREFA
ncbi:hypothetical protein XA68_15373 [Ophiocordyceps unilateralis]|uniref:Cytochrome b561 domain-containing protein n=1 Tax=Ophiocordyceps unilateralis TaxID=268505 RepID=A0A2A9PME8_OPHUN|nr:hypothetical protein XA68_15373 [Ophiocordyceps unilateralis]